MMIRQVTVRRGDQTRWEAKGSELIIDTSQSVKLEQFNYTADKLNRASVTTNGAVTNYVIPNGLNQYSTVGNQTLGYDENFNLKSYEGAIFTCNAQNQLKSASKGGKTVEFVYDGLGRCVKRTVNGSATVMAYDDWKPVMQFNSGWWGWNVYGPGADEILWQFRTDVGHLRYHHDRHGNVSSVLDGSGAVVEKYSYNAFGKPSILNEWGHGRAATTVGNRFMFQGREWIPELGIYDYRHRMYHPGLGRFLQVDPTGFDGGDMNLFRYCADDPVNRSDPDGLVDTWTKQMLWQGGGDGTVTEQITRMDQAAANAAAGGGLNMNWHGLAGMNNAARIDSAVARGPSVNWQDTGDENISQPYVYSDKGDRLLGRTYSDIGATGESYKGKLITLRVTHRVDVKYAGTAGEKSKKFARDTEPMHRNELRGWGLDSGRDIARNIANKYRNNAQAAVNEADATLKKELRSQVRASHNLHDRVGGDHRSPYEYEE